MESDSVSNRTIKVPSRALHKMWVCKCIPQKFTFRRFGFRRFMWKLSNPSSRGVSPFLRCSVDPLSLGASYFLKQPKHINKPTRSFFHHVLLGSWGMFFSFGVSIIDNWSGSTFVLPSFISQRSWTWATFLKVKHWCPKMWKKNRFPRTGDTFIYNCTLVSCGDCSPPCPELHSAILDATVLGGPPHICRKETCPLEPWSTRSGSVGASNGVQRFCFFWDFFVMV